jgi:hypothetical protein
VGISAVGSVGAASVGVSESGVAGTEGTGASCDGPDGPRDSAASSFMPSILSAAAPEALPAPTLMPP